MSENINARPKTLVMNKEIAHEWARVLRARKIGELEFTQGKGRLRDANNAFCCLGVLCEMYRIKMGKGEWVTEGTFTSFKIDDLYEATVLPKSVRNWAEISSENSFNPILAEGKDVRIVIAGTMGWLNDNGWDFDRIAEELEKQ